MRIRTSIFAITAIGLFIAGVQGCATDATVPDEEDSGTTPVTPTDASKADTNASRPDTGKPDTSVPDTSVPDTGKPDTAAPDAAEAGVDSGLGPRPGETVDPLKPKPGDPCPAGVNLNDVIERRCGKCGNQRTLCIAGAGGAKVVDTYGACLGEKTGPDACLPLERIVSACGFCGTQTKDCDLSCAYVEGACTGQVAGGCTANEITYLEGLCPNLADVKKQVCSATCVKGTPEACAPRPLEEIVISQTAGMTVSGESAVYSTKIGKLTTGTCPSPVTSTLTSYQYVRVKNDGAMAANVTISNVAPAGATKPDTVVALYPGPNAPGDRTMCVGSVSDFVESFTTSIPAGGSVIFHQSLFLASATNPRLKTEVKTNFIGAEMAPMPDHTIDLALVPGTPVDQAIAFAAATTLPVPIGPVADPGPCPLALSATLTPYRYVRVRNTGAVARTATIETVGATDTIIAYYGGDAPISTARTACTGNYSDDVTGLNGQITGVTVAPGAYVTVYVGKFSSGAGTTILRATTTL